MVRFSSIPSRSDDAFSDFLHHCKDQCPRGELNKTPEHFFLRRPAWQLGTTDRYEALGPAYALGSSLSAFRRSPRDSRKVAPESRAIKVTCGS